MASLAEIRAKLQSMESNSKGSSPAQSDNAIYPFWNIDEGTSTVLRFLPDSDPNNTFFWVERQMIRLTFPGVVGGDQKPTTVQVPCMEMFGENCPVLQEVRPWFKDPSLEDMGRKYWKKRSYIFQGFVVNSTLDEQETPENPIRRFVINPSIFNIIRSALMNPDMEDLPTDLDSGRDFKLTKTQKGGYADYSTSTWSFKARSLSESERGAINQYGLFNLSDFMPKKPSAEELGVMQEMFKASVDGELYDPDRFGQYYKPAGFNSRGGNTSSSASTTTVETPVATTPAQPVQTETVQPAVATPVAPEPAQVTVNETVTATATDTAKPAAGVSADDILAMIRSRQANK